MGVITPVTVIPGAGNDGRFQYTGQAWIAELGMYHYKARIYSPTLGRFLQTDPIGYEDQVNLYAYVANDPVNKTDPTGTEGGSCYGSSLCGLRQVSARDEKIQTDIVVALGTIAAIGIDLVDGGPSGESALIIKSLRSVLRKEADEGAEIVARTVGPGPYAKDWIPAGPSARPNAAQQRKINEIGEANGCHTCGTKEPGTKSGNFVGDHQPPTKLNPPGVAQRYYPHCQDCSRVQGGRVSQMPPPPPPPKPWWKIW